MLNAVHETKLKSDGYKSIDHPAKLQGRRLFYKNFTFNQDFFLRCLYEKKQQMHY